MLTPHFTEHYICLWLGTVKAWIRHNWAHMQQVEYPKIALLEAVHAVTPEKAKEWFVYSGYMV
jgi:hypothetical protein